MRGVGLSSRRRPGIALPLAALLLAACAATPSPSLTTSPGTSPSAAPGSSTPGTSTSAPQTNPAAGNRIVVGVWGPPFVLPPFVYMSNAFPFRPPLRADLVVQLAYNGLYRYNETLDAVPDLAAAPCDIAADKVTITCTLVNTTFHDGTPLTANDVVFTYELVRRHPECGLGLSTCLDMLESVTARDDHTVEFRLNAANATFLTLALPNVMIDSEANVRASYQPLADRAASLDPEDFEGLAGQIVDALNPPPPDPSASPAATTPGPPDCDALVASADELLTSAGLEIPQHGWFEFDGGPFDACLYADYVSGRLAAVGASLRTSGLDAISLAYPALSLNQHPVGTGPFRFTGVVDGNRGQYEAFDGYHFGRPASEGVEVVFTHDDAVISEGLQSSAIDWAPLSPPMYQQAKDLPGLQFVRYPAEAYTLIGYNLRPGSLFADHDIRSALELCIDKPATVAAATNGEGDVIYSPIDPISWAFEPDLRHSVRDVPGAKALIESAGWTMGADGVYARAGRRLSADIVVPATDPRRSTFLDLTAEQVKDCGMEINAIKLDADTVLGPRGVLTYPHLVPGTDKPVDGVLITFAHGFDPDDPSWSSKNISSAENPAGPNFMGFADPEVDDLLAQGIATYEQRERARIYRQLQEVLAREQPVLFAWGNRTNEALNSNVHLTDGPINLGSRMWWWQLEKLSLAP
jgi:ABC-type transport system substrate-binding protein